MRWIDTHFHANDTVTDFGAYVREAEGASVAAMLLCASGAAEAANAQRTAEQFDAVYFAAGLHPHDAAEGRAFLADLDSFLEHPKLAAAGESGLDYFYGFCPRKPQLEALEQQLQRALASHLPAVLHCRDKADSVLAYEDMLSLIRDFAADGGKFVLHCYAGTEAFAEKFLALGAYFGVGGMITFANAENIRSLARFLPLDRLLTETDAPYLAPKPFRGKPNHSKYIPLIGAKLAEVKGVAREECARITTANALKLFPRLKLPETAAA